MISDHFCVLDGANVQLKDRNRFGITFRNPNPVMLPCSILERPGYPAAILVSNAVRVEKAGLVAQGK